MKPTEEEIDKTFDLIQDRLEEELMKLSINQQPRLGYEVSLDILEGKRTAVDITNVKGVQASAIAMLSVDYLNGDCSREVLLGVPLKSGVKMSIN